MKAQVGDWIVVESPHVGEPRRIGLVIGVEQADGAPPYTVRWTEDDHESLFFPGPEAHVEKPEALFP
ncbi:DUF1918 domain-containing protein [Yinghuangia seranimata]|uniref:DUF1918 domain-containing protein n=1 Tax=Yinghuangia seranimata TaxID=408067 RepID=UPI00248C3D4F|nr:DUF1918 domain-containing protein [Yinghuangia seranimata]MDI2124776.1 DUF1918 domain-containing protein [Yinghuangia seranimata]